MGFGNVSVVLDSTGLLEVKEEEQGWCLRASQLKRGLIPKEFSSFEQQAKEMEGL